MRKISSYEFNTTIGVYDFCSNCKMESIYLLHLLRKKLEKDKFNEFELQRITGTLLHLLIQETFKDSVDQIRFFIHRQKNTPEEAIQKVLRRNLSELGQYFTYLERNHLNSSFPDTILGTLSTNIIMAELLNQIPIVAKISKNLIKKDNNGHIYCTLIDNEIKLIKQLSNNIILKGKIDCLLIDQNDISIIDVKTGRSKSSPHSKQAKLYSDLLLEKINMSDFKENYTIKPELWYTNPAIEKPPKESSKKKTDKDPILQHIKYPKWKPNEMLEKVLTDINSASTLTKEQAYSFKYENYKEYSTECKFCGYLCRFIDEFDLNN